MKKIIAIFMVLSLMFVMCGCGNQNWGMGNFEYNKVHVDTYHHSGCLTVESWNDSQTGIEVKTKEVGSLFLSEGTYILLENECPFCKQERIK